MEWTTDVEQWVHTEWKKREVSDDQWCAHGTRNWVAKTINEKGEWNSHFACKVNCSSRQQQCFASLKPKKKMSIWQMESSLCLLNWSFHVQSWLLCWAASRNENINNLTNKVDHFEAKSGTPSKTFRKHKNLQNPHAIQT